MRRTGTRIVYQNPWIVLREDTLVRDDGSAGLYSVIDKPTYALVIPLDEDRLHLVEQHRYPLGARRWEFPQGTAPDRAALDPGVLAARELREETGLVAAELTHLGRIDVAPGLSSQRGDVFLATGLSEGAVAREQEEQDMRAGWWSREEFETAVYEGRISDAQSLAAYGLLLLGERRGSLPHR